MVSHGPRPALYAGNLDKLYWPDVAHLVYSFNLTDLPQGKKRSLMAKAFQQSLKFVTYSTIERSLYASFFIQFYALYDV